MFSWRNEFLHTPPRAHLSLSSAPGRSSVAKGAPLCGPQQGQQHQNMFNSSELSVELLRQTQLYCYFKGRASLTTRSTNGLEQHGIGNMYSSSNSSLQTRETQLNISSGGRIMDDTKNYMVNQKKRRSLFTSMGASSYNVVQPEDSRMLIKEDIRPTKRPYSLWAPENCSVGSWNRSRSELVSYHCAINNTATQNFEHIKSTTVLEKISHDLLDDIDDIEPAGSAAEEAMVMSTVNSLSNLLQEDLAPATARSSEASYAHATAAIANPLNVSAETAITQVLDVASDAGSSRGGSNNSVSAIVERLLCEEEEQMGEIEMDLAYLSELLPFCP